MSFFNSNEITAGYSTLLDQSHHTANLYLNKAVEYIDKEFGAGYAKKNPELVGKFMKCCADDFRSSVIAVAGQNISESINK